jgi:hypothetical protein
MTLDQMDNLHWFVFGVGLLVFIGGALLIRREVKRGVEKSFSGKGGCTDDVRRPECWEHGCCGYHPCSLTK